MAPIRAPLLTRTAVAHETDHGFQWRTPKAEEGLTVKLVSSGSRAISDIKPCASSWLSETTQVSDTSSSISEIPQEFAGALGQPCSGSDEELGATSKFPQGSQCISRTLTAQPACVTSSDSVPVLEVRSWFSETEDEFGGMDLWLGVAMAPDQDLGAISLPSQCSGEHSSTSTQPNNSATRQKPAPPGALQRGGDAIQPPPAPWRPVPSIGSVGHPDQCPKPCRFFAQGLCRADAGCSFCHLPHDKVNSMDKRNRDILKAMSTEDRCLLFAAVLMEKAPRGSAVAIRTWAGQVGHLSARADIASVSELNVTGVKAAKVRRIVKCLEPMGVSRLVGLAARLLDGPGVAEACDGLLEELRTPLLAA